MTVTAGQSATGGAVGPEAGTRDLAPSQLSPCIASGAERSKFEQFKADSGYLHDPLAEELPTTPTTSPKGPFNC